MNDRLRVLASKRYGTLSPMRYPGGKAALAGLFGDIIRELGLENPTYVEPYAGGAGAGIALLTEGIVDHLVINDIDPAIYAFWTSILQHNEEFVDLVRTTPLTVEQWREQRDVYRRSDISSPMQLGFAFFYLNRTNRSGILNAGVIGGQNQQGNYKIDARFNRDTLAGRLQRVGQLAAQITVTDLDGRTVIQNYGSDRNAFLYIDPPYVQAGSQLYLNAFDGRDHTALADVVGRIDGAHWLMTYDTAPLIEKLYGQHFQCRLEITYSAIKPGQANELLVASKEVAKIVKGLASAPATALTAGAA